MTRIWVLSICFAACLASAALADEKNRDENAVPPADAEKPAPSQADQHLARAVALSQQRDYRKAVAEFTAAIRLEPKRAVLFVGRGKAHVGNRDLKRAFADFDLALRLDPKSDAAYTARADAWRAKGDFAHTKDDYESALKIEPKNFVAACNLAWLLATCPLPELRDGRRAVKLATQGCVQKEWQEPELLDTLAAAYAEAGNFDEARTQEIRALKLAAEKDRVLEGGEERLELYKVGQPYHEPPPKK